jgi:hypothetical protein
MPVVEASVVAAMVIAWAVRKARGATHGARPPVGVLPALVGP